MRSGARNDTWRPSSGRTGSPMLAGRAAGSAVGPDRDHLKAGLSLARPVATKRSRKRRWETSQATALPREGASGADFYPHERRPRRQRAAGGRRQRLACVRVGACARRDAVRPVSSNGGAERHRFDDAADAGRRAGCGPCDVRRRVVRFPGVRSGASVVGRRRRGQCTGAGAGLRQSPTRRGRRADVAAGPLHHGPGIQAFRLSPEFPQHHQRLYRRPFRHALGRRGADGLLGHAAGAAAGRQGRHRGQPDRVGSRGCRSSVRRPVLDSRPRPAAIARPLCLRPHRKRRRGPANPQPPAGDARRPLASSAGGWAMGC